MGNEGLRNAQCIALLSGAGIFAGFFRAMSVTSSQADSKQDLATFVLYVGAGAAAGAALGLLIAIIWSALSDWFRR